MDIFDLDDYASEQIRQANDKALVKQYGKEWAREDREDELQAIRVELSTPRLVPLSVPVRPLFLDLGALGFAHAQQDKHKAQRNPVRPIGQKESRPWGEHGRRKQSPREAKIRTFYFEKQLSLCADTAYTEGYRAGKVSEIETGSYFLPGAHELSAFTHRKRGGGHQSPTVPRVRPDAVIVAPVRRAACAVAAHIPKTEFVPPTPRPTHVPGLAK